MSSIWNYTLQFVIGILFVGKICGLEESLSENSENSASDFEESAKGRKLLIPIIASLFHKTVAPVTVRAVAATTPISHLGSCSNLPRTSTCGVNDQKCQDDSECPVEKVCCRQRGVQCCVSALDMCGALSGGNLACSDLIKLNPARECHDDFDCGYGLKCCSDGQTHHKCCSDVPAVCNSVKNKCPKSKDSTLSCSRSSDCGAGAKCCADTENTACCTSIKGICTKFGTINCTYPDGGGNLPKNDNCVKETRAGLAAADDPPGYTCNAYPSEVCCTEPGGGHSCCVGWNTVCAQRRSSYYKCGGRNRCDGPGQNHQCHETDICCADSEGVYCCVAKYL